MILYIGIGLAFFMGILQTAVIAQLRLLGVSPDLVLLLTIACVLLWGLKDGLLVALVGGVVLDIASSAPFGASILALLAAAALSGLGEMNVFRAARLLPLVATLVGVAAYYAIFISLLRLTGYRLIGWGLIWRIVAPKMVVNLLFMPLIYGAVHWVDRRRSIASATELP